MREITRVVRRICLLAEIDRESEATRVAAAVLHPLVERYRAAHGADALPDERIRGIQRQEQARARDAAALSELLFPLLAERLDGLRRTAGPAAAEPADRAPAAGSVRRPRSLSPEIADLLDGMLTQEGSRPPLRPRQAPSRTSAKPSPDPTNPGSHP